MTRAICGIASSSYHATRVLSDAADDEQTKLTIRESYVSTWTTTLVVQIPRNKPSECVRVSRTLWTKPAYPFGSEQAAARLSWTIYPTNCMKTVILSKTLGLHWHPVTANELDSVKSIGMPQGTANLIQPTKISSVDFEAIPVVVKNVAKFSPLDGSERATSENQGLVHSDPSR